MLIIVQIDVLKYNMPDMFITGVPLKVHHMQIFYFYYVLMKNETIYHKMLN